MMNVFSLCTAFGIGFYVGWRYYKYQKRVLVKDILKASDVRRKTPSVVSRSNNVVSVDFKKKEM